MARGGRRGRVMRDAMRGTTFWEDKGGEEGRAPLFEAEQSSLASKLKRHRRF